MTFCCRRLANGAATLPFYDGPWPRASSNFHTMLVSTRCSAHRRALSPNGPPTASRSSPTSTRRRTTSSGNKSCKTKGCEPAREKRSKRHCPLLKNQFARSSTTPRFAAEAGCALQIPTKSSHVVDFSPSASVPGRRSRIPSSQSPSRVKSPVKMGNLGRRLPIGRRIPHNRNPPISRRRLALLVVRR